MTCVKYIFESKLNIREPIKDLILYQAA